MKKIWLIAKKEFQKAVLNKGFIVITIIGPFLILGMILLQSLNTFDESSLTKEEKTIKVIGLDKSLVNLFSETSKFININLIHSDESKEQLKKEVFEEDINGFLEFPDIKNKSDLTRSFSYSFYTTQDNVIISEMIKRFIGELVVTERLKEKNFDVQQIKNLTSHPNIKTINVTQSGEGEQKSIAALIFTLLGFVMLLYMTIIFYGQAIGRSVVEEKTSKTVEIMLSSAKPMDMMFGKILGLGFAGLLQYAFWILMAQFSLAVIVPLFGFEENLIQIDMSNFGFLVLFFMLAFFLYAAGHAAVGAASKDIHNMGQLATPFIIFLIIPMASFSQIILNPESGFVQFMSYFPFTSPIVMFGKTLVSMPPISELLISIAILILSILGMVYIASRIFRVGILMSGKKFNIGEIVKWITYK